MRGFCLLLLALFAMAGCEKGEGSKANDSKKWVTAAKCKTDKDCADGFICNGEDGKKTCQKGERTAAEKAAKKKADDEAHKKRLAAKHTPDAGQGRLHVRICPFFKNTPESIGTITAVSQATKKKTQLHMAL